MTDTFGEYNDVAVEILNSCILAINSSDAGYIKRFLNVYDYIVLYHINRLVHHNNYSNLYYEEESIKILSPEAWDTYRLLDLGGYETQFYLMVDIYQDNESFGELSLLLSRVMDRWQILSFNFKPV